MNSGEKLRFQKELMALAIPLALQSLLQALVGASDALMLGRLTQSAIVDRLLFMEIEKEDRF